MGGLLGPGIESMSPALAGGFFTTEPPGKAKDVVVVVVVVVVDHFLKSIEFVTILFVLCFWFFGHEAGGAGGFLAPQPWIKPAPPNWKAKCLNHWTAREVPDNGFLIN